MSDEDWRVVIETNLSGVFHTCRAASRGMMKRRSGSIVNISSIVGVHGNPGQTNYSASKAGIIGFTKALARELGNRGVRANVVAPGYVDTRLTQVIADDMKELMLANTPLGRFGTPDDIAGAVRFLCSDDADRIGASIATGIGGIKSFQDCYDTLIARGPDRVNPFAIPCIIPNMGAGWVSMELGTRGPLSSECTACAASNMAIGQGLDDIRLGRADVMLCGGTESAINQVGIAGFGAMRALSRRNDDPKGASRPFDAGRDGFVMGEAGAVLVLEELERARARGAKIYAEVAGYGLSSDAKHVTEPDPTGRNPARA